MQLKRKLYYTLPPELRLGVRKAYYLPADIWKTLTGKRHKYEPLKGDIYIGSGDFIAQGLFHLDLLKKHLDLQPEDSVLDIGSGLGRTAVALTGFLNAKGKYEGFDVVEKGVKWCKQKINRDYPNFNFNYVPLKNDLYNRNTLDAQQFVFPYGNDMFDKVFLFSVFTHMSVEEIDNYLHEIKRVLKPGGLCLSTFLIYSEENEDWVANNRDFSFPVKKNGYRLMSDTVKSANICLQRSYLDDLLRDAELITIKTIEGNWKKSDFKEAGNQYQDMLVIKA